MSTITRLTAVVLLLGAACHPTPVPSPAARWQPPPRPDPRDALCRELADEQAAELRKWNDARADAARERGGPAASPVPLDALPPWLSTCHRADEAVFAVRLIDLDGDGLDDLHGKLRLVRLDADGQPSALPITDHFAWHLACSTSFQTWLLDLDGDGVTELGFLYTACDAATRSRLVTHVGLGLVDHPAVAGLTPYTLSTDDHGSLTALAEIYSLDDATTTPSQVLLRARLTPSEAPPELVDAAHVCPSPPPDRSTLQGASLLNAVVCAWLAGQPPELLEPSLGSVCRGDALAECQREACQRNEPGTLCAAIASVRTWLRRPPPVRWPAPSADLEEPADPR